MNIQTDIAAPAAPAVRWLGTEYLTAVSSAASGGRFGSFFATVPAGEGPPLHVHDGEDEAIHVLEGAADFWLDGTRSRLVAGQGVFLPRGIPHTFRAPPGARPLRLLGVVTPGGFEGFFAAMAAGGTGPHDPAALQAAANGWRVRFLGPSPLG